MLLKAKELKLKVKSFNKQINKEAMLIIDRHINDYLNQLLSKQKAKRITVEEE